MITMPAWVRLGPPIASTRRPVTLAPVLWAIVRAVRVLPQHDRQCMPREAVGRPVIPTFIVYDVLDVIGGDRRAR
jgi:hypothetical protein